MALADDITLWEPEETVGKLWHRLARRGAGGADHSAAAVTLDQMQGRLAVLFRGLGGDAAIALKPVADSESRHRRRLGRRLASVADPLARASIDAEALRLPARLAVFADAALNRDLYLWLAAISAHAGAVPQDVVAGLAASDLLRADWAALAAAQAMTAATLAAAPGLLPVWRRLTGAHLDEREAAHLRGEEARIEAALRAILTGAADSEMGDPAAATLPPAPKGYRPFNPVPMWPDLRALRLSARSVLDSAPPPGQGDAAEEKEGAARKARRHEADQADRKDSIILYKFEALLSWTQFLNLNRRVEDDDPDGAAKAAEDQDELGLAQVAKTPATRLKLHLDLAPEDADRERLSDQFTYPEWDARTRAYMPDHTRILASKLEPAADAPPLPPAAQRRIREVRRRFQALAPARIIRHGQPDGDELDLAAALRAMSDLRATGRGSDRIFSQSVPGRRDLAVSILMDVSRSTESAVTGRAVIDIAREALTALAWGLDGCGDSFAVQGFSSLRRDRVFIHDCKGFDEPMSRRIEARIAALQPSFYTRMGAAIRHASAGLAAQGQARRLLIVLTDGKPNDLDHYEGRHGIEDSAMAVREARRAGQAVFGITIDRDGQHWFPRLFGQGGFAVIRDPDRLTLALPDIYRHLVA